jgi:hypothetical protein
MTLPARSKRKTGASLSDSPPPRHPPVVLFRDFFTCWHRMAVKWVALAVDFILFLGRNIPK